MKADPAKGLSLKEVDRFDTFLFILNHQELQPLAQDGLQGDHILRVGLQDIGYGPQNSVPFLPVLLFLEKDRPDPLLIALEILLKFFQGKITGGVLPQCFFDEKRLPAASLEIPDAVLQAPVPTGLSLPEGPD